MTRRAITTLAAILTLSVSATMLSAQSTQVADPVLPRIWTLGMDSSQAYPLAQALLDSIGPRLTGTPQLSAAVDWVLSRYAAWGIAAHKEQYDKVPGWRRGPDARRPRSPLRADARGDDGGVQPGYRGRDVEAEAILPPTSSADIGAWLKQAKGKFVLATPPDATCRSAEDWQHWAASGSKPDRPDVDPGQRAALSVQQLDSSGSAGILAGGWSGGWGTYKVQSNSRAKQVPHIRVGCEDYGLVYRLAERGQHPRVRVNAEAERLGDVPLFNVVGEIKGTEKPNEYVILGEIGANAFVKAHPDIMKDLHVLFNQDDGTGRIASIGGEGFPAAEEYFKFFTKDIKQDFPGTGGNDSSDNDAFVEAGAPGFILSSLPWNYETYTWHTNRDTFDKISFDDVKSNATFIAMLTYLASKDAVKMPRK